MKKLLNLLLILLLILSFASCYGITVLVGEQDTKVIKLRYVSGDCLDKAYAQKKDAIEQGFKARVMCGRLNGKGHAWLEIFDEDTGTWRAIE